MAKLNWTPWLAFDEMKKQAERHLDEMHHLTRGYACRERAAAWVPAADAYETADSLVFTVELAGVSMEDVTVELTQSGLRIHGERRCIRDACEAAHHCVERSYGPFARTFPLPRNLLPDPGSISAVLRDGLLTVIVPKTPRPPVRRRIPIDIA